MCLLVNDTVGAVETRDTVGEEDAYTERETGEEDTERGIEREREGDTYEDIEAVNGTEVTEREEEEHNAAEEEEEEEEE